MGRIDGKNNSGGISELYFRVDSGWLQWRASTEDAWENLTELGSGGGAATIQVKTISSESANSVSLATNQWVDLNVDADGSLSILNTSTMVTGVFYLVRAKNTKSPVGIVTLTIPTGWIANTMQSTIQLEIAEYTPIMMWKDDAGAIHLSAGFSKAVA